MSEIFERRNIGKFEFNLIRQNRRAPSIIRDAKDIIWVYVNHEFTELEVENFVQRSSVQIAKLMEPTIKLTFAQKEIVDREEFLYLGSSYQLRIKDHVYNDFEFDGINFNLSSKLVDQGKDLFRNFYNHRTLELVNVAKVQFENTLGKVPKDIIVSELNEKWGVCTPTGIIKINWRAVMLPTKLFHYILAHEYAHLVHLNHSGSYWRCLEQLVENSKMFDRELEKYLIG